MNVAILRRTWQANCFLQIKFHQRLPEMMKVMESVSPNEGLAIVVANTTPNEEKR